MDSKGCSRLGRRKMPKRVHSLALRPCIYCACSDSNTSPKRKRVNTLYVLFLENEIRPSLRYCPRRDGCQSLEPVRAFFDEPGNLGEHFVSQGSMSASFGWRSECQQTFRQLFMYET